MPCVRCHVFVLVAGGQEDNNIHLLRIQTATCIFLRTLVRAKNKFSLTEWSNYLQNVYTDNPQVRGEIISICSYVYLILTFFCFRLILLYKACQWFLEYMCGDGRGDLHALLVACSARESQIAFQALLLHVVKVCIFLIGPLSYVL